MNSKLINDINNLKDKINNEIESLKYYSELSYICDNLEKEINDYEYDIQNTLSLKKYKAYLEIILEQKIGYINSLIINKNNESVFDNRMQSDLKKLEELENNIISLINYINNNFEALGYEITNKYQEIKNYYEKQLEYTKDSFRRRFNTDIGINNGPVLSIYSDTSSVLKSYINSLVAFEATYVNSLKVFVDNDIKIKELFKRAYETIIDQRAIESVKELELSYNKEISKCMKNNGLYMNTNILLIQENMIQNGFQLDKIVAGEKEKNNYYLAIRDIDLNYNNVEMILKIEEYVSNNIILKDDFYKVLYALVEKEKYLKNKFNVMPIIYNKISEKSRIILEKMFLEKIKDLDTKDKEEIIVSLKKNGFINALDKDYEEFFNNSKFNLKVDYIKEGLPRFDGTLECIYVNKGIIEPHYNLINKDTGKIMDRIFGNPHDDTLYNYGDIYEFYGYKIKGGVPYETKKVIRYYDKTGKRIKPFKDNSLITKRVFDLYFINAKNGKIITDLNFNKVFDYDLINQKDDTLIDYSKELILIFDHNNLELHLYDKKFNEIKKVFVKDIIDHELLQNFADAGISPDISFFNDGIVPMIIGSGGKEYIYYYDIINMKTIDYFKINVFDRYDFYGYSEGLYNYLERKGHMGYKNINGEVIIEPNLLQTHPFLNQCAYVFNSSAEEGFIDYQGNFTKYSDIIPRKKIVIKEKMDKHRYEIMLSEITSSNYAIIANNNYVIDCDDKILDIDFNENNKKLLK